MSDERIREKNVISAMAQNRWTVELTEDFFNLFEGVDWIDQEVRDEVHEISGFSDRVWEDLHSEEGYEIEAIKQMDHNRQKELADKLDRHTSTALDYSRQLLQRVEGQHDVVDNLPEIVGDEVDEAFEQYTGHGPVDVDLDYASFASELEQNIDYGSLAAAFDTDELAAAIASDIGISDDWIDDTIDADERIIANYISEEEIADNLDEGEIGRNIDVDESQIEVQTEFNGTVYVDPNDLEQAFEDSSIETTLDLDQNDYREIGREAANYMDSDVTLTQNDYDQIGQSFAQHIDVDDGDNDGLNIGRRGYAALAGTALMSTLAACFGAVNTLQNEQIKNQNEAQGLGPHAGNESEDPDRFDSGDDGAQEEPQYSFDGCGVDEDTYRQDLSEDYDVGSGDITFEQSGDDLIAYNSEGDELERLETLECN